MLNLLKNFAKDESGAVTVDWVVLTAAIVGLGLLVISAVRDSSIGLTDRIGTAVDSVEPGVDNAP